MIDIDALVDSCWELHGNQHGKAKYLRSTLVRSALLECERLTREECAKVCEELADRSSELLKRFPNNTEAGTRVSASEDCAAAIRGMK